MKAEKVSNSPEEMLELMEIPLILRGIFHLLFLVFSFETCYICRKNITMPEICRFYGIILLDKFIQFGLTRVTIEWANGADLAPEFLYEIGQPVTYRQNC